MKTAVTSLEVAFDPRRGERKFFFLRGNKKATRQTIDNALTDERSHELSAVQMTFSTDKDATDPARNSTKMFVGFSTWNYVSKI